VSLRSKETKDSSSKRSRPCSTRRGVPLLMICLEGSACRAVRGASGLAVKSDCKTIEPIRDLLLAAIDLN